MKTSDTEDTVQRTDGWVTFGPRRWLGLTTGALALLVALAAPGAQAAEQEASDGVSGDNFGNTLSVSGGIGLVGAYTAFTAHIPDVYVPQGAVYLFNDLNTDTGPVTETAKLTASDGVGGDYFGTYVSLSGSSALIGADQHNSSGSTTGAAYLFRDLDTATGSVTETAKLTASDGVSYDRFGSSVSLAGSIGLVGAPSNSSTGAAYLFRNLDTVTGSVTQNAKLTASGSLVGFGVSVSVSGTNGLVGATGDYSNSGAAYLFHNLDTASGSSITQDATLTASDGQGGDSFGFAVSLSGSSALVGAYGANGFTGAAYLFRNLDTATGSVTETVKLTASDGMPYFTDFGMSVSLSGGTGLVGANAANDYTGAAYLFRNLDTATDSVTEDVKFTASEGVPYDSFGISVSLDGDQFMIGANGVNGVAGKSYSGRVSTFTTLDEGSSSRTTSGLSFESRTDWIIGQTTSANQVTVSAGDTASVTSSDKAVYIGQTTDANNNILIIAGTLKATDVYVGSITGNTGNKLQFDSTATIEVGSIYLADGNQLSIEGDYTASHDLLDYLNGTKLNIWNGDAWTVVDAGNQAGLISLSYADGYTLVSYVSAAIPEPSTAALAVAGAALGIAFMVRRRRS